MVGDRPVHVVELGVRLRVGEGPRAESGEVPRQERRESGVEGGLREGLRKDRASVRRPDVGGISAAARREDGSAGDESFQEHRAARFAPRGMDQQVRALEERRHVVTRAEHVHPIAHSQPPCEGPDGRWIVRSRDHQSRGSRPTPLRGQGTHRAIDALPREVAAELEEERLAFLRTDLRPDADAQLLGVRARSPVHADTRREDAKALRRCAVDAFEGALLAGMKQEDAAGAGRAEDGALHGRERTVPREKVPERAASRARAEGVARIPDEVDVEPGEAVEPEDEVGREGVSQRGQSLAEAGRARMVRPARYGLEAERHLRWTVDLRALGDEGDLVTTPRALTRGPQGVALQAAVREEAVDRQEQPQRSMGRRRFHGRNLTGKRHRPSPDASGPSMEPVGDGAGPSPGPSRPVESAATRRGLLGALVGASATLVLARGRGRIGSRGPGEIAFWAADRAGHRVYGVDADGLVCVFVELPAPVAMRRPERSRPGEAAPVAVVVTSAAEGRRDGPRRDWRIGAAGKVLSVGPERAAGDPLDEFEGEVRAPEGWRLSRQADEEAPGVESHRLTRLGRRGPAFHLAIPFPVGAIADGGAGPWLACARTGRTLGVSGTGRVVVDARAAGTCGADAILGATAAEGGGAWVACGGALVRFDAHGRRMPGQGGFQHLVALMRAGPGADREVSPRRPGARPC